MKVHLRLKDTWDTVALKIKDTENPETLRRHIEDKLKAKENRPFVRKSETQGGYVIYRIEG